MKNTIKIILFILLGSLLVGTGALAISTRSILYDSGKYIIDGELNVIATTTLSGPTILSETLNVAGESFISGLTTNAITTNVLIAVYGITTNGFLTVEETFTANGELIANATSTFNGISEFTDEVTMATTTGIWESSDGTAGLTGACASANDVVYKNGLVVGCESGP